MNWRRWKIALWVSVAIGFFTACLAASALDVKLNVKFFLFFLGLIGKDIVLFLKDHPVQDIAPDPELNGHNPTQP